MHQDIASDKNLENLIHVKKNNPTTMCVHITFVTMRTSKLFNLIKQVFDEKTGIKTYSVTIFGRNVKHNLKNV